MMRILFILGFIWSTTLSAMEFVDDAGNTLELNKPAMRIISLAPHVTELLFEAGAGQYVVGVVQYSSFPPAAKQIQQVGDSQKLDIERIISMQPDLIIGWLTGNQKSEISQLKKLGFNVFLTEPRQLPDIASLVSRLGKLAGTEQSAEQAAKRFMRRYTSLKKRYQDKQSLRAFYQIWDQPLMTVNGEHIISDVMQLCGLGNIFADLETLTPRIDQESVLKADPQLIIAAGMAKTRPGWAKQWQRWPELSVNRLGGMLDIDADIIHRHSPRILQGAEALCRFGDKIRAKIKYF